MLEEHSVCDRLPARSSCRPCSHDITLQIDTLRLAMQQQNVQAAVQIPPALTNIPKMCTQETPGSVSSFKAQMSLTI